MMANAQNQTLGQKVGAWIQRFAILFATVWGIYTFVYKEMIIPQTAPVNITMNLELKKIAVDTLISADQNNDLTPVEMKVTARNPSTRPVYLLPSVWIAYGRRVFSMALTDDYLANQFNEFATATPNELLPIFQTHSQESDGAIVATGGLFPDTVLNPGETTMRTVIIYVPSGLYDLLDIDTLMPTVQQKDKVVLKWQLNQNTHNLELTMYDIHTDGSLTPMQANKDGSYTNDAIGLQSAESMSQFSLR